MRMKQVRAKLSEPRHLPHAYSATRMSAVNLLVILAVCRDGLFAEPFSPGRAVTSRTPSGFDTPSTGLDSCAAMLEGAAFGMK